MIFTLTVQMLIFWEMYGFIFNDFANFVSLDIVLPGISDTWN